MVHSDLVIIDAGINETSNGITGDVAPEVSNMVKAIRPVPGGVGTLTTVILFENLIKAMELQINLGGDRMKAFDQTFRSFLEEQVQALRRQAAEV